MHVLQDTNRTQNRTPKEKRSEAQASDLVFRGRVDWIRTSDPLTPSPDELVRSCLSTCDYVIRIWTGLPSRSCAFLDDSGCIRIRIATYSLNLLERQQIPQEPCRKGHEEYQARGLRCLSGRLHRLEVGSALEACPGDADAPAIISALLPHVMRRIVPVERAPRNFIAFESPGCPRMFVHVSHLRLSDWLSTPRLPAALQDTKRASR